MAYCHLTVKERAIIDYEHEKGLGLRAIARVLGRTAGTISRELKRNKKSGAAYNFISAGRLTRQRRSEQDRLRLLRDRVLGERVDEALGKGWSAEQVAGRLNRVPVARPISSNAIYRYIKKLKERGSEKIGKFLRCPKKRRKKRTSPVDPLGKKPISERPEAALSREEPGHWEGDTIVSSPGRPAILVFVDRKTRYLLARKINITGSEIITQETITAFSAGGQIQSQDHYPGQRQGVRRLSQHGTEAKNTSLFLPTAFAMGAAHSGEYQWPD